MYVRSMSGQIQTIKQMSGGVKNPELKLETKESLEEHFGEDLINK